MLTKIPLLRLPRDSGFMGLGIRILKTSQGDFTG